MWETVFAPRSHVLLRRERVLRRRGRRRRRRRRGPVSIAWGLPPSPPSREGAALKKSIIGNGGGGGGGDVRGHFRLCSSLTAKGGRKGEEERSRGRFWQRCLERPAGISGAQIFYTIYGTYFFLIEEKNRTLIQASFSKPPHVLFRGVRVMLFFLHYFAHELPPCCAQYSLLPPSTLST